MVENIGLYGGSFDPIHNGHLITSREAAEHVGLDRVVLLPSAHPPHKPDVGLLDAESRFAMLQAAVDGDPLFEVSRYDLDRHGPTFTIETVEWFRGVYPEASLYWLIGSDSLAELHTWKRVEALVSGCQIVTLGRLGFEHELDWSPLQNLLGAPLIANLREGILPTSRIEISSTEIRGRIRDGKSIRNLVPESVRRLIEQGGFYRPN